MLRAATVRAAALLGADDEIGAIKPGLRADLVVIEGDPLTFGDLGSRIRAVLKDGRVVTGDSTFGTPAGFAHELPGG